jgi:hypothetical protein
MGLVLMLMLLFVGVGVAAPARAAPLRTDEMAALNRGSTVRRRMELEHNGDTYAVGIAYAVISAPVREVMAAVSDPAAYPSILPRLQEAREVRSRGEHRWVRFRHATKLGTAEYSCVTLRASGRVVRFWMDPSRPHDIDDMFGYFRAEPFGHGKTLFTYALALRLPFAIRALFEDRIVDYAMDTPALLRRYLARARAQR